MSNHRHSEKFRTFNISSIPHRSPFRYPGGKTWLIPYIRQWLNSLSPPIGELVEPFAGGAIVGLTAVFENLAKSAVLIELDPQVAAVWRTILHGQGLWFAETVARFEVTPNAVLKTLAEKNGSLRDIAFATLLRNRVQRGGILAPDAGFMKMGENGRGLSSRWYPETIQKRILEIIKHKKQIRFIQTDGLEFLRNYNPSHKVAWFVDPPYTVASKRLYAYSDVDHETVFAAVRHLKSNFLMTYDNNREIRSLAKKFKLQTGTVPMKNAHNMELRELLISNDLRWLRK